MTDKLLTLKEVAKRLRVSERSIFRYIHSGKLKASKIGYWRIKEEDLQQFIKNQSNVKK
jgi:excisionase family DNA binding protein